MRHKMCNILVDEAWFLSTLFRSHDYGCPTFCCPPLCKSTCLIETWCTRVNTVMRRLWLHPQIASWPSYDVVMSHAPRPPAGSGLIDWCLDPMFTSHQPEVNVSSFKLSGGSAWAAATPHFPFRHEMSLTAFFHDTYRHNDACHCFIVKIRGLSLIEWGEEGGKVRHQRDTGSDARSIVPWKSFPKCHSIGIQYAGLRPRLLPAATAAACSSTRLLTTDHSHSALNSPLFADTTELFPDLLKRRCQG